MNINELLVDGPKSKPKLEPLHQPDDESGISLTQFQDADPIDPWLHDLCQDLLFAETVVQTRMILKLYLEDMLEDVRWGGTEV